MQAQASQLYSVEWEKALTIPTFKWEAPDSWWLLGEGGYFFVMGVASIGCCNTNEYMGSTDWTRGISKQRKETLKFSIEGSVRIWQVDTEEFSGEIGDYNQNTLCVYMKFLKN